MKKTFLMTIITLTTAVAFAQYFGPKDAGSYVAFTIRNFGLTVIGSFKGLMGTIEFNPANLATASVNVCVDAATVNTGNGSRDEHLGKENYFNSAAFPKITITSVKISNGGSVGSYLFGGVATIKGTVKSISFPFTAVETTDGYRFEGSFKINRRDFKVGGNSLVLGDILTVNLKVVATKIKKNN